MRRHTTLRAGLFVLPLVVGACANPRSLHPAPSSTSPSAPSHVDAEAFRLHPPTPAAAASFVPPTPVEMVLPNGLHVQLIERHDLPRVAMQLVVPHGSTDAKPRVGAFAMDVLSSRLRARLDDLAATASTWAWSDSTGASLTCLRPQLHDSLALLADAIRTPRFTSHEVESTRRDLLAKLASAGTSPSQVHEWATFEVLFPPGHAYRGAGTDRRRDLQNIRRSDLLQYTRTHLTPHGATLVVAGNVSADALRSELNETFGSWTGAPVPLVIPPAAPWQTGDGTRVFFVDWPDSAQTHVSVVTFSPSRGSDDEPAVAVLNQVLGATVSSRLGKALRERLGITYGAFSSYQQRGGPGRFVAGAAVTRDKTGLAIREIERELDRLVTTPVSAEELAASIGGITAAHPARFEELEQTVSIYADLAAHRLPVTDLSTRMARISAVTAADVQRAAETYLHARTRRIVVTGDARVVRADLEGLGRGAVQELAPPAVTPRK